MNLNRWKLGKVIVIQIEIRKKSIEINNVTSFPESKQ